MKQVQPMILRFLKPGFLAVFTVLALSGLSSDVHAAAVAASPCDPNYYDSLEARAWLEAQREITQNQNLIFKPDSVLEYTCFNRFAQVLSAQASNMFSESGDWGSGNNNMDGALQNLVGVALNQYISANFENSGGAPATYDLLGGRAAGIDHTAWAVNNGTYACNIMNQVWNAAKCMSFNANPAEDGFFTFAEYAATAAAGSDHRYLPRRCPAVAQTATTGYQGNINLATVAAQTPWTEDTVTTFYAQFSPTAPPPAPLGGGGLCSHLTPISTGLVIMRNAAPGVYFEKICLAPGCHYEPDAGPGTLAAPTNTGNCRPYTP